MTEKVLSVFIDESGDFGAYNKHAPYYLVSLVFHDQRIDIREDVDSLESHLRNLGYPQHAVHTGPLIRRESVYVNDLIENRKKLFSALFNFARRFNFNYTYTLLKKSECDGYETMIAKQAKLLKEQLLSSYEYLQMFDKIIVYYDNGQVELTKILKSVFHSLFSNVEFRKVKPNEYKLFQVADLICTVELLSKKIETNSVTRSEIDFFDGMRKFKKNYLKWIRKKLL